ncbi:hypothetical protein WJX81_007038 [Elliptochloris bilobata]|uniref:Cytochrome P450 n=1 Tax=Elliptochloris bilobata TaxID=381761 RepID=A0AAW1QYJ0_9CHLO
MDRWYALLEQVLQEVRAREPPGASDVSLMAHLLRLVDPATGRPLSDAQLLPELGIVFVAGMETSGKTMGWTLYCISQHSEVEARIAAELAGHGLLAAPGQPAPRTPAHDDLAKLGYLNRESMRLYPVAASGTARQTERDMTMGGRTIPAGTVLVVPLYPLMNSPHVWDCPAEFRPDRWLEEDAEYLSSDARKRGCVTEAGRSAPAAPADAVLAKRFIPFSDGPRDCVGRNLATMNIVTTLATLLGRFTFRLAETMGGPQGVRAKERLLSTLQIEGGMKMHAVPRVMGL